MEESEVSSGRLQSPSSHVAPPVSLCTAEDSELWAGHLYYRLPNWENTLFTARVMNLYLVQQRVIFNYRAEQTHT